MCHYACEYSNIFGLPYLGKAAIGRVALRVLSSDDYLCMSIMSNLISKSFMVQ